MLWASVEDTLSATKLHFPSYSWCGTLKLHILARGFSAQTSLKCERALLQLRWDLTRLMGLARYRDLAGCCRGRAQLFGAHSTCILTSLSLPSFWIRTAKHLRWKWKAPVLVGLRWWGPWCSRRSAPRWEKSVRVHGWMPCAGLAHDGQIEYMIPSFLCKKPSCGPIIFRFPSSLLLVARKNQRKRGSFIKNWFVVLKLISLVINCCGNSYHLLFRNLK